LIESILTQSYFPEKQDMSPDHQNLPLITSDMLGSCEIKEILKHLLTAAKKPTSFSVRKVEIHHKTSESSRATESYKMAVDKEKLYAI
jgi:hypothetical protein